MASPLRFILPSTYARNARELWYLQRYDIDAIRREERAKFAAAGFDRERGMTELNEHLAALGQPSFNDCGGMASLHWLLFACLRQRHAVRRILEIGTFDGGTTALLAQIFPESKIITLDLPASDPLLRNTYGRRDRGCFEEFEKRQARNTRVPNITCLKLNSFFLPAEVEGPFDLVWVDGGHLYPEIAWDLCNAYHLSRDGGVVMCDDVVADPRGMRDADVSPDSHAVLRYITERTGEKLWLFLKRESPKWSADPRQRRFVGLVCKGARRSGAAI